MLIIFQGSTITPVFYTNQFNRTEVVLKNAAGAILGGVQETNIISKNGVVHVIDRKSKNSDLNFTAFIIFRCVDPYRLNG